MCYKLFFVKGDYKIAQKKANKAQNTNNLSSNNEGLQRKSKHKMKKKKIRRKKSDSENGLSSEISDIDDTIFPNIAINHTQLRNSK